MVEEALDDILHMTLHEAQSGVQWVVYNVHEQVMLDMIRQGISGETLDAHITKFLDTDEDIEGFLKRLLRSTSFKLLILTLVRQKGLNNRGQKI